MNDMKLFLGMLVMMFVTVLCGIGVEFAEDSATKPRPGRVIPVATIEPSK